MTKLIRYLDTDNKGRYANIRMDNNDPCWVGIARTGTLVKKSKIGLFGAILYEEKNIYSAAKTTEFLLKKYPDDLTPEGMWNLALKSTVNAILHCSSLAEVVRVLNEAYNSSSEAQDEVERTRQMAEQGNANAQFHLGTRYYAGVGVAKDKVKAVAWLRKAAEQGHLESESLLDSIQTLEEK